MSRKITFPIPTGRGLRKLVRSLGSSNTKHGRGSKNFTCSLSYFYVTLYFIPPNHHLIRESFPGRPEGHPSIPCHIAFVGGKQKDDKEEGL